MATQEKTWNVANRLHSQKDSDNPEVNHIIAGADEIYDDAKELKQSEHNAQTDDRLSEVETDLNASVVGIKDRVHTLEEQVAFEGEFEVENTPQGIVTGSGKVTSANAVRGAIDVRTGYFECTTASGTASKEISAPGFVLSAGGSIKIKMANANTADNATLDINSTDAKALYYAGERASANNSWEEGETVEVYYDGTSYYANNVAGGSGSGDGAFDVSAKYPTSGVEGGNTYTLEGALAVLNANLSANKKKGGMSIKFIQNSDNNYVQYRLTAQNFTTDVTQWQGVDDELTDGNENLVNSKGIYKRIGFVFNNNTFIISSGGEYSSNSWKSTGLIPVMEGDTIELNVYSQNEQTGTMAVVAMYDANQNYVSASSIPCTLEDEGFVNITATIPAGIYFIRSCSKKSYLQDTYIYVTSTKSKEYISQLRNQISSISGLINNVTPDRIYGDDFVFNTINVQISGYTEGGYINAGSNPIGIVTSQTTHSAIVNCQAGDEFFVYCDYAPDSANAPYFYGFGSINAPMTPVINRSQYPNYISYYSEGVYKVVIPEGCGTFYLTVADRNRRDDLIRTIVDKKTLKWLLINGNNIGSETISQIVTELIGDEIFDEVVKTIAKNENDSNAALYHTWDSIRKPIVFTGKSISAYGDSITQGTCSPNLGNAGDNMYIKQFCNFAGTNTPNNRAIGGSCIADNENYDAQYAIYKRIKENASDTEIIWIAGGTNDFNQGVPVGSYDSTDVATFYGALRNMCEWLKTNRPNAVVIFVTPIPYTKPESAYPSHVAPLDAYRSAIYDIATEYEYNVVDGKSLGMPRMQGNWNNYMCVDSDGCHPTIYGHRLMARNLCWKLL